MNYAPRPDSELLAEAKERHEGERLRRYAQLIDAHIIELKTLGNADLMQKVENTMWELIWEYLARAKPGPNGVTLPS